MHRMRGAMVRGVPRSHSPSQRMSLSNLGAVMASYLNMHRKDLTVGDRVVKPGGTFTDDEAAAAGISVAALVRAGTVRVKPAPKKKSTKKADK